MNETLTVPLEVKALNSREIQGHGSVFRNIDMGGDIVIPGAFRRTLGAHKRSGTLPQMFWMHKPDHVPGRWTAMSEDDTGLAVRGELADTALGNDMRALVKMKAVRGLSIGYRAVDVDYDSEGNRLLKDINLIEVSLVSLAMNPLARIESAKARLSSTCEYVSSKREFESFLRQHGFSRKFSETAVARIFSVQGDPDPHWDNPDEMVEVANLLSKQAGSFYAGALPK